MTVPSTAPDAVDEAPPAATSAASAAASSARRITRASAAGGAVGLLLFFWMVTTGTLDPLRWQAVADFYDEQAHGFLRGDLAFEDPEDLGIEGFLGRGGRTYMYQGPVPALLRLPLTALAGHRLDGRLTQLSMLAAAVVLLVFATRLHRTVRQLVRGDAPVTRAELGFVALFAFTLVGGSSFLYLASRAWVYHEALAWGAALALASIDRLVELVRRPRVVTLAWASVLVAATLQTRVSVGLGPLAGMALLTAGSVLAAVAARRRRHWPLVTWLAPGTDDAGRRPNPALFALATLLPLASYAALNYAKFEQLFGIPFWGQRFTIVDRGRQAMLAANDGTLFGLQFTPTTLLHYLRPDGLDLSRTFPFVEFPPFPGPVFGDVIFDLIDRTSGIPVALSFFAVLGAVGIGHAFRPGHWVDPRRASLRVPLLAAGAGAVTIFPFGYISNRYLGDFVPLLALAGLVGLQVVLHRWQRSPRRRWRAVGATALVVLAAWTAWVNVGLALLYQRQWSPLVDHRVLAGFIGFQNDVDRWLGGDGLAVTRIGVDDPLPDGVGRPGQLVVAGDCDGLYLSDGMSVNDMKVTPWNSVERSVEGGRRRFRVTVPRQPPGTLVPILTGGTTAEPYGLLLEYLGGDRVRFHYRALVDVDRIDRDFPVDFDEEYELDVMIDRRVNRISVRIGDTVRLESWFLDTGPWNVGANAVFPDAVPRFPGRLDPLPVETPLCDRLVGQMED